MLVSVCLHSAGASYWFRVEEARLVNGVFLPSAGRSVKVLLLTTEGFNA